MNLRFGAGPPAPPAPPRATWQPPHPYDLLTHAIHTALCCWALTFGVLL